jgi:uncharacterized membrane protein
MLVRLLVPITVAASGSFSLSLLSAATSASSRICNASALAIIVFTGVSVPWLVVVTMSESQVLGLPLEEYCTFPSEHCLANSLQDSIQLLNRPFLKPC